MPKGRGRVQITLSIDDRGDITVSPTVVHLTRGHAGVEWIYDMNQARRRYPVSEFGCMFAEGTPFGDIEFTSKAAQSGRVRRDAPLQSYHYAVTITSGTRIFQITGCPEIIIRAQ